MEKKCRKRVRRTKVGDVMVAQIDEMGNKRYLQYIGSDRWNMNADVVRVFKTIYSNEQNPSLEEVVSDEVLFYIHCDSTHGIRTGLWEKVGNTDNIGSLDIYFRTVFDEPDRSKRISHNWRIWKFGDAQPTFVGTLPERYWNTNIGLVCPVANVFKYIKNGIIDFCYFGYK